MGNILKKEQTVNGSPVAQSHTLTYLYTGDKPNAATMIGNYDIPAHWPRPPLHNPPGSVPGPPEVYAPPVDPDDVAPGYRFSMPVPMREDHIFFYHTDHLGSTSYITDGEGSITQFVCYMPFGQAFVDVHTTRPEMPFKFNGKELDTETGLYYFGARYYDPMTALWYGVDPLAEKYTGLSPYAFVANNPIKFIDPDGRDIWEINNQGEIVNRIKDKNQDKFVSVSFDSDGNKVDGQSISFEYGTVSAVRTPTVKVRDSKTGDVVENKLTTFEMKGDENATQLFEFFANPANTSVEWTDAKIGTGCSGRNIVGTSHDESSTAVGAYLRHREYTLRAVSHNHPSGIASPSRGDIVGAQQYHNRNQNTVLKIYTHPGNYVEYNQFGIVLPPVIVTP